MNMQKMFSILLVLAVIFIPVGLAATGDSNFTNVVASGDVTSGDDVIAGDDVVVGDDLNVTGDTTVTGDLTFKSTLLANGRTGGASTMSSSSTYLSVAGIAYSVIQKRVGGGGGLDSAGWGSVLPAGTDGQELALQITALQSGGTWVVTTFNSSTFTKITFDTVGDNVLLQYVNSSIGWIVKSNQGATVTVNQLP